MTVCRSLAAALMLAAATAGAASALAAAPAPTAHDPHYGDAAFWPAGLEADKAAYARETWSAAPVLVWAGAAGDPAGKMLQQVDEAALDNPANWRQADGQPATKGPDDQTDVVFPAQARVAIKPQFHVRHVTLAPGARVSFGDLQLAGNLWIQKGATFGFTHGNFDAADKDTFARSDNDHVETIANYLRYRKQPEKGTEFLGRWKMGDQVFLYSGRFIIGPGTLFQHTDRFPLDIFPQGALVLLSGATYEARGNYYQNDDVVVHGQLLAGTPQRPLTRDCTLGLSFKAQGQGKGSGALAVKASRAQDVGLLLMPKAVLAVYSSDPARARLVFRWHRNPQTTHAWGATRWEGKGTGVEPPEIAAMQHGICLRLFGEVRFDGVVLHDVIRGGIQMPDPALAQQWRQVSLGQGNFGASLAELVSAWTGPVPAPKQPPPPAKKP